MRKVGLDGVSLHSLRHSHASALLSKGVPIAVVAERLGHADQNITLSIYSHALPADSRAAAKTWNDQMADVILRPLQNLERPACLQMFARQEIETEFLLIPKGKNWRGRRGSNPRPST